MFGPKKICCEKNIWLKKTFFSEKIWKPEKNLGSNKIIGLKKFWVRKFFGVSIFLSLRVSSIKGSLPSMAVTRQKLSSIKGCLPSKIVFHQRSSSIKGHLPRFNPRFFKPGDNHVFTTVSRNHKGSWQIIKLTTPSRPSTQLVKHLQCCQIQIRHKNS